MYIRGRHWRCLPRAGVRDLENAGVVTGRLWNDRCRTGWDIMGTADLPFASMGRIRRRMDESLMTDEEVTGETELFVSARLLSRDCSIRDGSHLRANDLEHMSQENGFSLVSVIIHHSSVVLSNGDRTRVCLRVRR